MLHVIPAINCEPLDVNCVAKKLHTAEEFAEWVHLDIADGVFTFHKSWNDPESWKELSPKVHVEVHLMVEHPERVAEEWLRRGAKRIIFHYEAFPHSKINPAKLRARAVEELVKLCRHYSAELMLAINPETKLEHIQDHLTRFTAFQIFSQAIPGPSGQKFLPSVLPKIRALRATFPNATIEVDGGINLETARLVHEAGADTVVSGSLILDSDNPRATYDALRSL